MESHKKTKRTIGSITKASPTPNSAIFKATFVKGQVEAIVLTDQGADANLIPLHLVTDIQTKAAKVHLTDLQSPAVYSGVPGEHCLTCDKSVALDVYLKMRHGSSLILRNNTWHIPKRGIQTPIIGRMVLQSLGCNNREVLIAAKDRLGNEIDVAKKLSKDGNYEESSNMTASLFGESVFYNGRHIEEDGLAGDDIHVEFGDDPPDIIKKELQQRIMEVRKAGLPKEGVRDLMDFIATHESIFRIRMGNGEPAKVQPLKIALDPNKTPVKVKVRR